VTRREELPEAAARYVDFVEQGLGVGVTLVGTGRERERVLGEHRPAALAG
jgi:adenylosuccinate synthase